MGDTLTLITGCILVLIILVIALAGLYVAGWLLWGCIVDAYRWIMEN